MHTTEYQYSFGLNLDDVIDKANIGCLLQAIADPPNVGGNHSRFAYDFSPASIVLRVTRCHSSRIQNCFEHDEPRRSFSVAKLINRVESGDIPASELLIGGELASTDEGKQLEKLGVLIFPGIRTAMSEAIDRITKLSPAFAKVSEKIGAVV